MAFIFPYHRMHSRPRRCSYIMRSIFHTAIECPVSYRPFDKFEINFSSLKI